MAGRFLANIYDPAKPGAKVRYTPGHDPVSREMAWASHVGWIAANVVGPPRGTANHSVGELEAMGLMGLYASLEKEE